VTASDAAAPATFILSASSVSVRFGTVAALTDVDFSVRAGAVHALVGENGAGKSTLMRVMSGAIRPNDGALAMDGMPVSFASPRDARRAGVRMIHQELSLVPGLSVAENIFLGAEPSQYGVVSRDRMRRDARAVLTRLGEDIDPDVRVGTLSLARREMVEIAKALASPVDVLILDEPTAILSARETDALFRQIATLRQSGVGVVYCSHRLDEIGQLADEITVLRDGVRVAHGPARAMSRGEMIRLMVGRAVQTRPVPRESSRETPVAAPDILRVDRLDTSVVRGASFAIRAGEIVALVGLVGAGRTELARAIIGADHRQAGAISVDGRLVSPRTPGEAVRAGIAYVSEDRKAGALIPLASVRHNITLARLRSFARGRLLPILDQTRERAVAATWVDALRIRIRDLEQSVDRLSGGNQQKIVLARWLMQEGPPLRVLIVDEPTRGVDAGAREEIHSVLRDLAARGAAVLAITSDLEEAFAFSDRLLVMREGRITGALETRGATPAQVAALMVPE
jgi:ribose transport system ATP-binding protein